MSADDDLRWYVPGFVGRRRRETKGVDGPRGDDLIVTVSVNGRGHAPAVAGQGVRAVEENGGPTRYALALRRQATNRVRKARGDDLLPGIGPGACSGCEGWGVVGAGRGRCARCHGSGEEG